MLDHVFERLPSIIFWFLSCITSHLVTMSLRYSCNLRAVFYSQPRHHTCKDFEKKKQTDFFYEIWQQSVQCNKLFSLFEQKRKHYRKYPSHNRCGMVWPNLLCIALFLSSAFTVFSAETDIKKYCKHKLGSFAKLCCSVCRAHDDSFVCSSKVIRSRLIPVQIILRILLYGNESSR